METGLLTGMAQHGLPQVNEQLGKKRIGIEVLGLILMQEGLARPAPEAFRACDGDLGILL
jgi:hypothetical protein